MYTIKFTSATTLKQSTKQASELSESDRYPLKSGESYPVAAWSVEDSHIKFTLGKDKNDEQLTLNGKNTWYAWKEHCTLTQNGFAVESIRPSYTGRIDWNNPNSRVSRYFTVREVTNGDPRRIPQSQHVIDNVLKLAAKLDIVRDQWGSSIGVTSWYRPPAINAAVGGVPNSQHIEGSAADIYPVDGDIYKFQSWLDGKWNCAMGYGGRRGFVHVDLRPGFIRWNY